MNSFLEMEWGNAKWDWENLVMYGSKVSESSKKLQLTDWGIEEEGEMDAGSFNLSGGGSGSGRSGSDLGNGSSGKSSISASTDSSPKDGMKTSSFTFEALKGSFGDISMKTASGRVELSGTPLPLEGSVGSTEPLIGLKLGKRTYFENSCSGGGNAKSPSSVISVPSTTAAKKTKSLSPSAPIPRCQVEGCNLDLSSAKEYHRKHRVCDSHSKSTKVIVGGVERRFCQQCSRFHSLSEFDEKKRSCRRRLSDHNARRRKPQQETIQFNSSRLPSSFYDCRQQMNFVLNDAPLVHARNAANSEWERSTYGSKFTITRELPSKPDKAGGMPGQPQMMGNQLPHAISMHGNTSNGFLGLKGGTSQVFSQGFKESIFSSTVDAAPEFRRALSLLSTNSCGSYKPESISPDDPVRVSHSNMPQTVMHAIPQTLPLASVEYWPTGQPSTYPRAHTLPSNTDDNGHLEGIQVFKTSYEEDFYQNPLN